MNSQVLQTRRRIAVAMIVLGLLGLVVAAYYYSFCFLLEDSCVLQHEGACEALARTLRFAAIVGVVSLATGLAGVFVAFRSRTRQLPV